MKKGLNKPGSFPYATLIPMCFFHHILIYLGLTGTFLMWGEPPKHNNLIIGRFHSAALSFELIVNVSFASLWIACRNGTAGAIVLSRVLSLLQSNVSCDPTVVHPAHGKSLPSGLPNPSGKHLVSWVKVPCLTPFIHHNLLPPSCTLRIFYATSTDFLKISVSEGLSGSTPWRQTSAEAPTHAGADAR